MVVSPVGLGTKNHCNSVGQQQFTQLTELGWGIGPSQGLYIGQHKHSKNADPWTRTMFQFFPMVIEHDVIRMIIVIGCIFDQILLEQKLLYSYVSRLRCCARSYTALHLFRCSLFHDYYFNLISLF
jgi:hypothetical protein